MIIGKYVASFTEADMGMLQGASLNAPYEFHWLYVKAIEGKEIVFMTQDRARGREIRAPLKVRKDRKRQFSIVTVSDPIFGPIKFEVAPFKRSTSEDDI